MWNECNVGGEWCSETIRFLFATPPLFLSTKYILRFLVNYYFL